MSDSLKERAGNEVSPLIYEEGALGGLRRVVVYDSLSGPKDIGVSEDFLKHPTAWKRGALTNFASYKANLTT